jgi:hypothetical protein
MTTERFLRGVPDQRHPPGLFPAASAAWNAISSSHATVSAAGDSVDQTERRLVAAISAGRRSALRRLLPATGEVLHTSDGDVDHRRRRRPHCRYDVRCMAQKRNVRKGMLGPRVDPAARLRPRQQTSRRRRPTPILLGAATQGFELRRLALRQPQSAAAPAGSACDAACSGTCCRSPRPFRSLAAGSRGHIEHAWRIRGRASSQLNDCASPMVSLEVRPWIQFINGQRSRGTSCVPYKRIAPSLTRNIQLPFGGRPGSVDAERDRSAGEDERAPTGSDRKPVFGVALHSVVNGATDEDRAG